MGGGMGRQLLENGCNLLCYDPNPDNSAKMEHLGAIIAETAGDLAQNVHLIILSLPKAAIVTAVMHEIMGQFQSDTVVLDTSTSEPETSQRLAALGHENGFSFVDGPVSGGPVAANDGTMTMLLGGDNDAINRLKPILDIITAKTVVLGKSGAGHAAKIANNMLCAANLVLLSEAVRIGQAAGVAPKDLLEGINAGSGRSGVSEVNFPKWISEQDYNSGFTMGLMRKDVGLAVQQAVDNNLSLPITRAIAKIWEDSRTLLDDGADFNEIFKYEAKDV
jgi:3-hydroxyisobutyrate dehydrogenase